MKHTESAYINAGARFERVQSTAATLAAAAALRAMLDAETLDDRAEARRLIEQGRAEIRLSAGRKR
tara:strand:- start:12494 stop:12691 length:198 start_codon:yes stop_codon:yes gene_type:complete